VQYKTIIELITDADDELEAVDVAGEYLRGTYNSHVPLHVQAQPLTKRNFKVLGYTISICLVAIACSFVWFSAGRTYQQIAINKQQALETYAVQPPLHTDLTQEAGKEFKKSWDKLYREKVLYNSEKNITATN
jgi:hypothetical protein